jgi:hypothetical protein
LIQLFRHRAHYLRESPSLPALDLDHSPQFGTQTLADPFPRASIAMFPAKAVGHVARCLVAAKAAHLVPGEREAREEAGHEMVEEVHVDQERRRKNLMQRWRITGAVAEPRRTETLPLMLLPNKRAMSRWLNKGRRLIVCL